MKIALVADLHGNYPATLDMARTLERIGVDDIWFLGDALVKEAFAFSAAFEGEIPGAKKIECGNYLEHDLPAARAEAAAYLDVLAHCTPDTLTYPD